MARPFAAGDRVLLVDAKRRRHLITLAEGGEFHSHAGVLEHDELIGSPRGRRPCAPRWGRGSSPCGPTLAEYVLEMPRGAQVIYPKDLGPILILADVFTGANVLESGVGSGALTLALLRAVGPTGSVRGYEIRDDFAAARAANVEGFLGSDVPAHGRGARRVRRHRRGRPRSGAARPARAVARGEARRAGACTPAASCSRTCPTIGQVARLREELAGSRVRHGRDARGAPPHLARRRPVGATRPPDGGPHRLPHPRTAARRRARERPRSPRPRWPRLRQVGSVTDWASLRRVASWAGLIGGVVLAIVFVDNIAEALRASPPRTRLLGALAFVLLVATIGQAHRLRDRQHAAQPLRRAHEPAAAIERPHRRRSGRRDRRARVDVAPDPGARELARLAGARGAQLVRSRARSTASHPTRHPTRRRSAAWSATRRSLEVFDTLTSPDAGSPPEHGVPVDVGAPSQRVRREGRGDRVRPRAGGDRFRRRARDRRHQRARGRGGAAHADRDHRRKRRSTPTSSRSIPTATSRCSRSRASVWLRSCAATATSTTRLALRSSRGRSVAGSADAHRASRSSPAAPNI